MMELDTFLTILVGFHVTNIMNYFGMLSGYEAVNYYGEVHNSQLNKIIHFVFMPITLYGILIWLSSLIYHFTYYKDPNHIKKLLYLMYLTHYMTVNIYGAIFSGLYVLPSLYFSMKHQIRGFFYYESIKYGLVIMIMALLTQEFFGHFLGGDQPSRLEAIPNAIVYAVYFAANRIM